MSRQNPTGQLAPGRGYETTKEIQFPMSLSPGGCGSTDIIVVPRGTPVVVLKHVAFDYNAEVLFPNHPNLKARSGPPFFMPIRLLKVV